MRQIPRLFVEESLGEGAHVSLDDARAHYLAGVLRLAPGAEVRLLDDRTGEWRAWVADVAKKRVALVVEAQIAPREEAPDLWLLTAPIRRERFAWIVEKATELGVARILPVRTARTVRPHLNRARLRAHMIEAAEQCERTALPVLDSLRPLDAILGEWDEKRALYFCDEEGGAPLATLPLSFPAAILIGPEGGFADEERQRLLGMASARRITLGPRILRADTAVVAAISQFQAIAAFPISR